MARNTTKRGARGVHAKSKGGRQAAQGVAAAVPSIDTPGTLGEWLAYVGADPIDPDWIPVWPPDAFAVSAALLRRTGAYVGFVNGARSSYRSSKASRDPETVGKAWRQALVSALGDGKTSGRLRDSCPREIHAWWDELRQSTPVAVAECGRDPELVAALCNLCIASDVACAGIGVVLDQDPFLASAHVVLDRNELRSFCLHIPVDKIAVLAKQHTPQRGCTIRSLTHHLALYSPTEIKAYWKGPFTPNEGDLDVMNLLLLPWPTDVGAADFRVAMHRHGTSSSDGNRSPVNRYFDYSPRVVVTPRELSRRVEDALDIATAHAEQVHGIVFPELALTPEQFTAVEKIAVSRKALLISGIRETGTAKTNEMPTNACAIQPLGLTAVHQDVALRKSKLWDMMRCVQYKHHRWCLDRRQILQYGLGGRLPASRDCWERIYIGARDINFVTLGSWLTMCVLICEDLARQDPVSEVIRAVGPNIVFALLMDGPQLRNRWSSRYASVLAEDPGSSVLTLTSLGMARRSRPNEEDRDKPSRNTVIGLWRDSFYGEREITLESGHDACVLSLVCKSEREFTIDGRGTDDLSHSPVFAGAYSFDTNHPA